MDWGTGERDQGLCRKPGAWQAWAAGWEAAAGVTLAVLILECKSPEDGVFFTFIEIHRKVQKARTLFFFFFLAWLNTDNMQGLTINFVNSS